MLLHHRWCLWLVLLMLGGMVFGACGFSSAASPSATRSLLTPSLVLTSTPAPSPSPTPEPPIAILWVQPATDPALAAEVQALLSDLSAQAGLRFQMRETLKAEDLNAVQAVVVLPPDPGLAALASAAPETQFLAVGLEGVEPAVNVSLIHAANQRPDQLGFLAGYVAAAITADWRVGVVSQTDTPAGKAARLGFINGVRYFCGLCLSAYPPFPPSGYPLWFDLPALAGAVEWQSAIAYFKAWQVTTVFVAPSAFDEEFLEQLAQSEINFILGSPPPPNLRQHWVASLGSEQPSQPISELWPRLLAGEGGQEILLPLSFTALNPELISPGRQRAAEEMLSDLLAGLIDTGVDLQSGESRY